MVDSANHLMVSLSTMMKPFKASGWLLSLLISFASLSAQAEKIQVTTTEQKPVGSFGMGAGSLITLTKPNGTTSKGTFLGELVHPNGEGSRYLFLDHKKTRVYLVPKKEVSWKFKGAPQQILSPYEQVGGTCASYAMFDYFLQLKLSQTVSPTIQQQMDDVLGTEQGRTQLLATAINNYYLESRNHSSVASAMNKIAKPYGLKCKEYSFDTHTDAIAFLKTKLDQGIPVTVEFFLGPNMVNSSYEVQDFESLDIQDPRLWIPRRRGEREAGGHTIVLAASFYTGTRFKAVVIDSDWEEPRIWDVNNYLSKRTVMDGLVFTVCK